MSNFSPVSTKNRRTPAAKKLGLLAGPPKGVRLGRLRAKPVPARPGRPGRPGRAGRPWPAWVRVGGLGGTARGPPEGGFGGPPRDFFWYIHPSKAFLTYKLIFTSKKFKQKCGNRKALLQVFRFLFAFSMSSMDDLVK